jgi:hypothetical protein
VFTCRVKGAICQDSLSDDISDGYLLVHPFSTKSELIECGVKSNDTQTTLIHNCSTKKRSKGGPGKAPKSRPPLNLHSRLFLPFFVRVVRLELRFRLLNRIVSRTFAHFRSSSFVRRSSSDHSASSHVIKPALLLSIVTQVKSLPILVKCNQIQIQVIINVT